MSAARSGAWDGGPPGAEIDYTPRPSVDGNNMPPLLPSRSQWPPPLTVPPPLTYPAFSNINPVAPNSPPFQIDNSQVRQASDFFPGQQQDSIHRLNQVRDDKDDKFSTNKPRRYPDDRKYQKEDSYTRRRSRSRDSRRTQKDSSHFQTHPKTSQRSRSRSTSREKKFNRFKKTSSSSSDRSSMSPQNRRRRTPSPSNDRHRRSLSSPNDRRRRSRSSSGSLSAPRKSRRSPVRTSRVTQNFRADNCKNISKNDESSTAQRYTDRKNINLKQKSPNRSRSRDRNTYQQRQTSGRHYPRSRSRSKERYNKQYDSKEQTAKSNQSSKKNSDKRSSSRESNPAIKDSRTNVRERHPADSSERNRGQSSTSRRSESHYRGSNPRGHGSKNAPAEDTKMQVPAAASFKNDGSFLEMFKKLQESQTSQESMPSTVAPEVTEPKKAVLPFIGKRRGGRVLKTGMVKKAKTIEEHRVDDGPKDAWSLYLQEVKKYRETSCEEEGKTRPLVK